MNIYLLILLRFVHVVAGILWAGAAVYYLFFVKPSVQAIGPIGPQFMQHLTERRKMPIFMLATSLLTVLAGSVLFWVSSGHLSITWMTRGAGLGFTIGSVASLVAIVVGSVGVGPVSGQISSLGAEILASGKEPTQEQAARMHALEKRLNYAEVVDFVMLAIAMLTMATARYWIF